MAATNRPNPWRYYHMGMELAIALVVLALAGLFVDSRYGTDPWGLLIGAALGFTLGMYLFIRQARAAMAQSADASRRRREERQTPDHDASNQP